MQGGRERELVRAAERGQARGGAGVGSRARRACDGGGAAGQVAQIFQLMRF